MSSWLAMAYINGLIEGDRAENLEEAIRICERALEEYSRAESPAQWAETMHHLGVAYFHRLRGEPAENLEKSRVAFEASLEVRDPRTMPAEWASTVTSLATVYLEPGQNDPAESQEQAITRLEELRERGPDALRPETWALAMRNLGSAYFRRIRGNRSENLDRAVEYCEQSLAATPETDGPHQWAETWNNLAAAYLERSCGRRADNLEKAITLFIQAREAITPEELPERWPTMTQNLARAYSSRVRGNRAENLERALELYYEVLRFQDGGGDAREQAETYSGIARVLMFRIRGDRAENLERGLSYAQKALALIPEDEPSELRAKILICLGSIYFFRVRGDRGDNLNQAAARFRGALAYLTPESSPRHWSNAKTTLARVYTGWQGPDQATKIDDGIALCHDALRIRRRETMPRDWAETMNALGDAYSWRVLGDRAENLEQAIAAYEQALLERSREAAPTEWLETCGQLAGAYRDRRHGDPVANFDRAVQLYRQVLEIVPRDAAPLRNRNLHGNLGRLLFQLEEWEEAAAALEAALEASALLYRSSATPEGRQVELDEAMEFAPRIAYGRARLDQLGAAVEALEGGRTQLLGEALDRNEALLARAAPADRTAFLAARQRLAALEAQARTLDLGDAEGFASISESLHAARSELETAIQKIRAYAPEFMPAGMNLPAILAAAEKIGEPLVFLVATPHGSLALMVTPGGATDPLHAVWLDRFSTFDLRALMQDRDGQAGYLSAVVSGEQAAVREALGRVWESVQESVMAPLAARLAELGFRQAMLVPCGTLGLLPLPALHRRPLAFSLVPSARALQTALAIGSRNGKRPPALLAVEDPSGNLPSAAIEVEQIRSFFPDGQLRHLKRRQATLEATAAALDGVTHLHLACHGTYRADRPLESALILAGGERLTLRDLLDGRVDLSGVQLAVLSACETGVFDVKRAPDETIGLPAGLLQAGVPAVISTLWSVADVSTALLLGEFYRLHLGEGMTAPIALSRAQAWLRDATAGELRLAEHYQRLYRRTPTQGFARKFKRYRSAPDVRPFADPYYWAPFVFSGVG